MLFNDVSLFCIIAPVLFLRVSFLSVLFCYAFSNYTCESSMTRSVLAICIIVYISSVCQDCSTPPTKLSPLERRCPRPTPNIAIVIQLPYFPTGLSPLSRPSFSTLPSWNIQTTSKPFMTLSMIPRPPLTHRRFL